MPSKPYSITGKDGSLYQFEIDFPEGKEPPLEKVLAQARVEIDAGRLKPKGKVGGGQAESEAARKSLSITDMAKEAFAGPIQAVQSAGDRFIQGVMEMHPAGPALGPLLDKGKENVTRALQGVGTAAANLLIPHRAAQTILDTSGHYGDVLGESVTEFQQAQDAGSYRGMEAAAAKGVAGATGMVPIVGPVFAEPSLKVNEGNLAGAAGNVVGALAAGRMGAKAQAKTTLAERFPIDVKAGLRPTPGAPSRGGTLLGRAIDKVIRPGAIGSDFTPFGYVRGKKFQTLAAQVPYSLSRHPDAPAPVLIQTLENIAESSTVGAGTMTAFRRRQIDAASKFTQAILDAVAGSSKRRQETRAKVSAQALETIAAHKEGAEKAFRQRYDDIDTLAGTKTVPVLDQNGRPINYPGTNYPMSTVVSGVSVPLANYKRVIGDDLLPSLLEAAKADPENLQPIVTRLTGVLKGPDRVSFGVAQTLRSAVLDAARQASKFAMSDTSGGISKKLAAALNDDMKAAVAGNKPLESAFSSVSADYRKFAQQFEPGTLLAKAIESKGAKREHLDLMLVGAAIEDIRSLQGYMDSKSYKMLVSKYFENMLRKSFTEQMNTGTGKGPVRLPGLNRKNYQLEAVKTGRLLKVMSDETKYGGARLDAILDTPLMGRGGKQIAPALLALGEMTGQAPLTTAGTMIGGMQSSYLLGQAARATLSGEPTMVGKVLGQLAVWSKLPKVLTNPDSGIAQGLIELGKASSDGHYLRAAAAELDLEAQVRSGVDKRGRTFTPKQRQSIQNELRNTQAFLAEYKKAHPNLSYSRVIMPDGSIAYVRPGTSAVLNSVRQVLNETAATRSRALIWSSRLAQLKTKYDKEEPSAEAQP